ncbi:MAG: hypothetical protein R6V10_13755 [bacterium]
MEKSVPWVWLGLGIVMTLCGGLLKYVDVAGQSGAFDFVFFRGADYILLIAGLVLVILSLGHDLLFQSGADNSGGSDT